jgi:hypothetical protein
MPNQPNTWADMLDTLPTLATGQAHNLKVDTGERRVWLARTGLDDGEPFARTVYIEELTDGRWLDVGYFDGDEPEPRPWGAMSEAWTDTVDAYDRATVFDRIHDDDTEEDDASMTNPTKEDDLLVGYREGYKQGYADALRDRIHDNEEDDA